MTKNSETKLSEFPALVDTFLYRFSIATITLLLGAISTPTIYGFYSGVFIAVGLFQSSIEGVIRGTSSRLWDRLENRSLLKNFSQKAAIGFTPILLLYLFFLWAKTQLSIDTLFQLLPVLLVPAITVRSAWIQRVVQLSGDWALIARSRLVATLCVLPISLYFVLAFRSLLAATLFMPLIEVLMILILKKRAKLGEPDGKVNSSFIQVRREIGFFIPFQIRFWLISQADRLAVAFLSSPHVTGLYMMATSLTRLPFELTTGAYTSLLRNRLNDSLTSRNKSELACTLLFRLRLINGAAFIAVLGAIHFLASAINRNLGEIEVIVTLLMSSIFMKDASAMVWTRSIFENGVQGKARTQSISIMMNFISGLIVSQSLIVGVLILVLRELATSIWILWKWRVFSSFKIWFPSAAFSLVALAIVAVRYFNLL